MAGVPNYSKHANEVEEEVVKVKPDLKSVRNKFRKKEPMTAEEFGIYLGGCSLPIKEISEKTIKRYIKKLCKESNGKINEKQFMSVVDNVEMYYIQPEYQQLLVVLFDTDYFGAKGRCKKGVDEKQRLRAQLAENVESFLEGDTLFQVKVTPQFLNARLEDILASKIENEIRGMLATIQIADDTIQYQLMLETLDRLVAIRRWMNEWNTRIQLIKQEFANSEAEKQDAIDGAGKFMHKELKDIIVEVISARLDGKEYEFISEEEEIFFPTLYAAFKMYDITAMPGHELTVWLNEIERNISNDGRYKCILQKAKTVFDENDLLEGKILESIDKIARTQLVSNEAEMTPEQYEILVRMQSDVSVEEKQKLLCKLEESGDMSLDEKTLKELIDLKDGIEKKRKAGLI